MKTIAQIYSAFRIMPNLQLHQLRVAAIAKTICERLNHECNIFDVIVACLIHDMGNIIKSKLDYFPAWTEAGDLKYWQQVKQDFIAQYGEDERAATLAIAGELGVSSKAVSYISCMGFSNTLPLDRSWEKMVCLYADMRVGPEGVISLQERFSDLRVRYGWSKASESQKRIWETRENQLRNLEQTLTREVGISSEEISDHAICSLLDRLRMFPIETPSITN